MEYLINDTVYIQIDKELKELIAFMDFTLKFYKTNKTVVEKIENIIKITVRKLSIPKRNDAKYIGDECIFVDNKFYVFDSRKRKIEVPFNHIDSDEVIMEVEDGSDPLAIYYYVMEAIIRYKLVMNKNTLMLHSAGVKYKNLVIAFPAWGGTGKTNLLLALLKKGAEFYSDDLLFLNDSSIISSYVKPLNLFNYNLEWFPDIKVKMSYKKKILIKLMEQIHCLHQFTFSHLNPDSIIVKSLGVFDKYSKGITNIKVPVYEVFPMNKIGKNDYLNVIIHLVRSDVNKPKIEKVGLDSFIESIDGCHKEEWIRFNKYHNMFKYLSGESIDIVHNIGIKEKEIMRKSLKDTPIYFLYVPRIGMTKDNFNESIKLIEERIINSFNKEQISQKNFSKTKNH